MGAGPSPKDSPEDPWPGMCTVTGPDLLEQQAYSLNRHTQQNACSTACCSLLGGATMMTSPVWGNGLQGRRLITNQHCGQGITRSFRVGCRRWDEQ